MLLCYRTLSAIDPSVRRDYRGEEGGSLKVRERGAFHIPHDASRLVSIFFSRLKERSRVSREIFNEQNFKMELIQVKFQYALLTFGVWLII